jgi:hypothetical protein
MISGVFFLIMALLTGYFAMMYFPAFTTLYVKDAMPIFSGFLTACLVSLFAGFSSISASFRFRRVLKEFSDLSEKLDARK